MYQQQNYNPFEMEKMKISKNSKDIATLLIANVGIGFAIMIVYIIIIASIGLGGMDPNNIYSSIGAMMGAVIALGILVILFGLAFIVIFIIIFVKYGKMASNFKQLYLIDRSLNNFNNVATGIYLYIAFYILGIIIPRTVGTVLSLLATISLAVAFYFMFQGFKFLQQTNRFKGNPSPLLLIGIGIMFIGNIFSFTNIPVVNMALGLVGFILEIIGFKRLEIDILKIEPGTGYYGTATVGPMSQPPVSNVTSTTSAQPTGAAPTTQSPLEQKICPVCGAQCDPADKFCQNCGARLD